MTGLFRVHQILGGNVSAVDFTRWFLALFFVGVAVFYTIRILILKHRMGTSPVFSGRLGSLHWTTHTVFRVFRVVITGVCLTRLWWPELDAYLLPVYELWHPALLLTGDALLLAAFISVVAIHLYMGENWRSGTRKEDRARLITTGPFAVSRNPMMLGVVTAQVGFFLALPSLFTVVCLILGVWAVTAQVGVEERLLQQRYGKQYEDYAAHTPRWLSLIY